MIHQLISIIHGKPGNFRHCNKPETIQDFFTCSERSRTRREVFGRRMSWRDRIMKRPLEVLDYFRREKVTSPDRT